jgi:DNA-binding transcriptional MerR regulator
MEMRVEQLSARSEMSVDTIRYYQSKGLLDPPRRQGRVAWYHEGHLARLDRIRTLQHKGFTLATIARLVSGDLDAADEALLSEISGLNELEEPTRADANLPSHGAPTRDGSGPPAEGDSLFTVEELAIETGVPLALLKAVAAEGLLIPRQVGGQERYTAEDVAAANAGLLLLEWGIPLSALLDLARRHHEATKAVAHEAVELFSTYVRRPLRDEPATAADRQSGEAEDVDVERLVRAYSELLPAVNTLVANHFTRTLVNTALDHVEQAGSDAERRAISDQVGVIGAGELIDAPLSSGASLR